MTLAGETVVEQIPIRVPAIIDPPVFAAVLATLPVHNPCTTSAHVIAGPILLTGLATCTTGNGPMTLRPGTWKSGRVHRYDNCATHGQMGRTGRSIAMDPLDTLWTDHLMASPASLWATRAEKAAQVDGRVATLRDKVNEAPEKLKRLYRMIGEGPTERDDILKGRLAALEEGRDRARTALGRIHMAERALSGMAPELVEQFGRPMRANVTSGKTPFRKA